MFVHTLFFWGHETTTAAAIDQLEKDCRDYLAKIPSVRQLHVGRPAPTARPIVDNTYSVGLTVIFDDLAGHDAYQAHELHKQFIQRNNTSWQRVRVFDCQTS